MTLYNGHILYRTDKGDISVNFFYDTGSMCSLMIPGSDKNDADIVKRVGQAVEETPEKFTEVIHLCWKIEGIV